MAEERVQRRLAAILAADVVGYSRLMGEDEAGTRARFNAHLHELIEPAIASRRGRIVKTMGDGLLVEFTSVVDAVQCAVDIQKGMADRNADETDDRRIEFRIGVNSGDVIIEGDDIHGDGVNVASRLEGLAEPGGICVSGDVYRQCRGKLEVGFDDLGEQEVKNITEPVLAYRVLPEGQTATAPLRKRMPSRWRIPAIAAAVVVVIAAGGIAWWQPWVTDVEPASIDKMAFKLPDRPSIAVLPFTNMSDDRKQEYFADGITEDITTDLSKVVGLFITPSSMTRRYKGKDFDPRVIAGKLGVRHILEGGVRRAGNRLRITAKLIDASSGAQVWAERYDRDLKDVFIIQDDIAD
ncbi:MAG: adenylate/guanylate cyclase domain-containing protein, partial [Anaerolineales bacterium]